ncbi:MAG: hypothetical protein FE78DRAFT_83948, partial [Acidomyces sp. 'richmondensis']
NGEVLRKKGDYRKVLRVIINKEGLRKLRPTSGSWKAGLIRKRSPDHLRSNYSDYSD